MNHIYLLWSIRTFFMVNGVRSSSDALSVYALRAQLCFWIDVIKRTAEGSCDSRAWMVAA